MTGKRITPESDSIAPFVLNIHKPRGKSSVTEIADLDCGRCQIGGNSSKSTRSLK